MSKLNFDMPASARVAAAAASPWRCALPATIIGLACLALVLGTLLFKGLAGLSLAVFTEMTPPPGADGGLAQSNRRQSDHDDARRLIGTPIGILAGTYMAEYGRHAPHLVGGPLHQ